MQKVDGIYTKERQVNSNPCFRPFSEEQLIKDNPGFDKARYFIADVYQYALVKQFLLSVSKGKLKEGKDFMFIGDFYGDKDCPSPYEDSTWIQLAATFLTFKEPVWDLRTRTVSSMIDLGSTSVLDLGAGTEILKFNLSPFVKYTPVDYIQRTSNTIVCNFNEKEFPEGEYDTVVASGVLQYLNNADWFIKKMCSAAKREVIISYEAIELGRPFRARHRLGFKNNFTIGDLVAKFYAQGMILETEQIIGTDVVFKFVKKEV